MYLIIKPAPIKIPHVNMRYKNVKYNKLLKGNFFNAFLGTKTDSSGTYDRAMNSLLTLDMMLKLPDSTDVFNP